MANQRKPRSAWGAATGKAARLGRLVQSTVVPSDELSPAAGSDPDTVARDRGAHGHFLPGNKLAKAKKVRSGPRGALAVLEAQGDPAWKSSARWGRRYASHRRNELARAHGGELSAGVGTIIESAADLMSDARYWRAKAIATGDPELSRLAAQLTAQARGCERDAWELAAREHAAKQKSAGNGVLAAIEAAGSDDDDDDEGA